MGDERLKCPRCLGKGYLNAATATVGDMVAKRRLELGLTQLELAAATGVSRGFSVKWQWAGVYRATPRP